MPTEYCRHILTAGRRCAAPAVRASPYCYFHGRSRRRHQLPPAAPPTQTIDHVFHSNGQTTPLAVTHSASPTATQTPAPGLVLDFPPLEDRESIQVAASMIVAALGRNQLDTRRAASMLYGLQVASAVTRPDNDGRKAYYYETDIVPSPDGADLSPDEDPVYE